MPNSALYYLTNERRRASVRREESALGRRVEDPEDLRRPAQGFRGRDYADEVRWAAPTRGTLAPAGTLRGAHRITTGTHHVRNCTNISMNKI